MLALAPLLATGNGKQKLMNSSDSQPAVTSTDRRFILWRQVVGLAAVQGAITLTWVIYKLYLPKLLTGFGFPAGLAATLLIVESALAVVMEPLMGGLSDRRKQWVGTRFPFISVGVILSSALFIAIPCFAIFVKPDNVFRLLLPAFVVAWALAMTVFRAPALALLGQYAAVPQLPQAASLLTLAGGIIAAFGPISSEFLLSLGAPVTFTIGSLVLLAAVALLRSLHSPATPGENSRQPAGSTTPVSLAALASIFGTGIFVACGSSFLMALLPKLLKIQFDAAAIKPMIFAFSILLALAAVPAGKIAVQLGNRRGMLIGVAGTALWLLLLAVFLPSGLPLVVSAIIMVAFLSLVNNGAIPFALSQVPAHRAGLGVGMYFGGIGTAASLLPVIFGQLSEITPVSAAIKGAIAFITAGVCIAVTIKTQPAQSA
jgi:Na+/melibiose symporter-like transporter